MILKLMAEQKATATFWALSCADFVQTGSVNTTSLRALAETFVKRERFVGVCYRATNVFGKGGSEKRVRSVRDGPGDAMIRRIITRFSAGLSSNSAINKVCCDH